MVCILPKDSNRKWPGASVTYLVNEDAFKKELADHYDRYKEMVKDYQDKDHARVRALILEHVLKSIDDALAYFNAKTNFRFVGHGGTGEPQLEFRPAQRRCGTSIGFAGKGMQTVGCDILDIDQATMIHELGHVVGLLHEQNRADRNDYVKINWPAIDPEARLQFLRVAESDTAGTDYEYKSVMQYPRGAGHLSKCSSGWTDFAPFVLDGMPCFFSYKRSTGMYAYCAIAYGGAVDDSGKVASNISQFTLKKGDWTPGYTCFTSFQIRGRAFLVAYRSEDGELRLYEITAVSNDEVKSTLKRTLEIGAGITSMEAISLDGRNYLLMQDESGARILVMATADRLARKFYDTEGLKGSGIHLMEIELAEWNVYLEYVQSTGAYRYLRFTDPTGAPTVLKQGSWRPDWSAFMPYYIDGHSFYLAYKSGDGEYHYCRVAEDGTGQTTEVDGHWTRGWTSFMPYRPAANISPASAQLEARCLCVKEGDGDYDYCYIPSGTEREISYTRPGPESISTPHYSGPLGTESELSAPTIRAINALYEGSSG